MDNTNSNGMGVPSGEKNHLEKNPTTGNISPSGVQPNVHGAQATPQPNAPRVQAAPQPNAPRVQAAPQPNAPRVQAAPQPNAPRVQAAPQPNAPRVQATSQPNAPRVQATPQQNVQGAQAAPQNAPSKTPPTQNQALSNDATLAIKPQQKSASDQNGATKQIDPLQKGASAELDTNKKKSGKKKKGGTTEGGNTVMSLVKCMAYITVVLIVSTLISVFVILAANDIYGFVKSEDPVEITISEGDDIDDIADILHDNNVIRYKWLFKMMNKDVTDFRPGTYTVTPSMSYDKLIAEFREKVPTGVSWITIPEGFTTDEIIDLLVKSGIGERETYVDVINNYDFDYWFIDELGEDWAADGRIYRLDGYLFPDTYQFYNASSEETVIKKLLSRFNQVFVKSYKERAAELGYTVDEILTLASIIEKEAANQSEFGDVSSVFHNRLNDPANFPRLESDATVVYSIQHETGIRPNLTGEDLERDDPYNSYKVEGLVPGPIANPSNSAILAALNPKNTNYYYFVSNGKATYFASDITGHNANKDKYLKPSGEGAS